MHEKRNKLFQLVETPSQMSLPTKHFSSSDERRGVLKINQSLGIVNIYLR